MRYEGKYVEDYKRYFYLLLRLIIILKFAANITDQWFYKGVQRKNSFEPRAKLFPWLLFCSGSSLLGRNNNCLLSSSAPALHVTRWCLDLTQENIWNLNTAFNLMPSFTLVKWFLLRTPTLLNWITWIINQYFWIFLAQLISWSWISFCLNIPSLPSCYCHPGCCKVETECCWQHSYELEIVLVL